MREAREETLGALRQTCKTASMVLTTAAERQRAVRCQTQPAEDRQFTLALVQASPRTLGEFDPRGQIPPQRLLIGAPAGAQRSGSGGERRSKGAGAVFAAGRKRSLADFATTRTVHGPFSFFSTSGEKRKWGVQIHQPSSWLKSSPPVRAGKTPFRPKGGHPISSDGTQDKSTSSTSARCRRGRDHSGQSC